MKYTNLILPVMVAVDRQIIKKTPFSYTYKRYNA